ncbi:MAG: hypothetical protein EZS28_049234, partial [Streblomastix strix]
MLKYILLIGREHLLGQNIQVIVGVAKNDVLAADVDHEKAGLTEKSTIEANTVGIIKRGCHFHFVHIIKKRDDGDFQTQQV